MGQRVETSFGVGMHGTIWYKITMRAWTIMAWLRTILNCLTLILLTLQERNLGKPIGCIAMASITIPFWTK